MPENGNNCCLFLAYSVPSFMHYILCIAVICFCICRVILKSAQYIAKALKENFLHDFDEQVSVLRN